MPRANPPRPCAFVPAAGRTCPHPALPRQPYCHLHAAIHAAAGSVAGGFVSELLSWFSGGRGSGLGFDEPPDDDDFPDVEAMMAELMRKMREHTAYAHRQASQPPRRVLNYYHVLGVPPMADGPTIKTAFRKVAFDNHPDRNKDPKAAIKFKQAVEAYTVLSHPQKRAQYDNLLRYARPAPEKATP